MIGRIESTILPKQVIKKNELNKEEIEAKVLDICAFTSKLVYSDEDKIKRILSRYEFSDIEFYTHNDSDIYNSSNTEVVCFRWLRKLFIVFRGTESNLSEWVSNFDLLKLNHQGRHGGFLKAFRNVESSINNWVERIETIHGSGVELVFSGHSLGGALATIAAEIYCRKGKAITHVITFASPRVGSRAFAKSYQKMKIKNSVSTLGRVTSRYKLFGDVVTNSPPFLLNFCHVGTERFSLGSKDQDLIESSSTDVYSNSKKTKRKQSFYTLLLFIDPVLAIINPIFYFFKIKSFINFSLNRASDHSMSLYLIEFKLGDLRILNLDTSIYSDKCQFDYSSIELELL